jgi:hypothetical protein
MNVTVIGSCRVHGPLRWVAAQGLIAMHDQGVYGYTHCTKEALQQLEVLQGKRQLTDELWPYIADSRYSELGHGDVATADALVVEISSVKEISFRQTFLQSVFFRTALVRDRADLAAWWKDLRRGASTGPREDYVREDLSDLEQALVRETTVELQAQQTIHDDMRAIATSFEGPVDFVSHFDVTDYRGRPVAIREQLIESVAAGAAKLEAPYCNPGELARRFGRSRAVRDRSHYHPDFVRELGMRIFTDYLVPIGERVTR